MAGDDFKKVKKGDTFRVSARAQNAMLRAGQEFVPQQRGGPGPLLDIPFNTIRVRNSTSGDLPQYSILAIDDLIVTPDRNPAVFQQKFAFDGVEPVSLDRARFIVTQTPLHVGQIGPGVVHGLTWVQLEVTAGEEGFRFADIFPTGNRTDALWPQAASGGAMVLWKETGTGFKWAVVRISNESLTS
jgi:hypothetical protein